MDICQQYVNCMKMYFYIVTYITHLRPYHTARTVYVSTEQLPHDGFVIQHDHILLPIVYELHRNCYLHPSDNDTSD